MKRIDTNTLLAYTAIVLSAVSAFGVIWQTMVASDQREASVWPYVQAMPSRNSNPPSFDISLFNVGVGPALIRYFAVSIDGKPVGSWREFLAALSEDEAIRQAKINEGIVQGSGWVIAPNTNMSAFNTQDPQVVNALVVPEWGRIDVTFCYCSVFDQCWVSAWWVSKRADQPKPVASCPTDDPFGIDWTEMEAIPVQLQSSATE